MNRGKRDRVSSAIFFMIALAICMGSVEIKLGNLHRPGPGFFSFLAGSILGVISAFVFINSFKGQATEGEGKFWPKAKKIVKIGSLILSLLFYAIGMNYVGFIPATFLFVGLILMCLEFQRWPLAIIVAALASFVAWLIFKYWLDVQLPKGFFGF